MVRENRVLFFPFVFSIIVHFLVFAALPNIKTKKYVQKLSAMSPISVAMFYKASRTHVRKASTKSTATEAAPMTRVARREIEKTSKVKLSFEKIKPHARKNIKKIAHAKARNSKVYKKRIIKSPKLIATKKLSAYTAIKKTFTPSPRVNVRSIIAKLPKEFSVKYSKKPEEKGETLSAKTIGLHKPKYPRYSRAHGEEGNVIVLVRITANGKAENIRVLRSSGYGRLDRAAVIALNDVNFLPARLEGRSISSEKQIDFSFRLE